MSNTSLKPSPRDLERAELLWDCFLAAIDVLASLADQLERLQTLLGRCAEAAQERKPSKVDVAVGRSWLERVKATAEVLHHEAQRVDGPAPLAKWRSNPLSWKERTALASEFHRELVKELQEVLDPTILAPLELWELTKPDLPSLWELNCGRPGGGWEQGREALKGWKRRVSNVRGALQVARNELRAPGTRERRREMTPWQCPKGVYLEVGAHRVFLVRKDEKGTAQRDPVHVERNTRARAILDCLLVEKFHTGEALKRAIEESRGKPIADAVSRIVGKENRQVFAPRLRKHLPDLPQDVVAFDPTTKRYGFRIPLRPAAKE